MTNTKKVLVITHLFPPLDCGVGRQIKFVKYLPTYGWTPIVLAAKKSYIRPIYDPSRIKEIPQSAKIYRTFSLEIVPFQQWMPNILEKLLGINPKWFQPVDPFIGWIPFALRAALKIVKEEKVDLIFSTSLPNTCHLVALMLKKKLGLPWVADFRDPWTQNPYVTYPKPILKIEEPMEKVVIRNADKVTTTNSFFKEGFIQKHSDEPKGKFVTITHGFDPDDFQKFETTGEHKFAVTYTGSLYGTRKPDVFLKAVNELLSEDAILKNQLKIRFVGSMGKSVENMIHKYCLEDTVEVCGLVSHERALEYLFNSSVLLLITGVYHKITVKDSSGKVFVEFPGKLVEYLAIGRPILALAMSRGTVARMINSTKTGVVVHPNDKEGIKKAIRDFYSLYKSGNLKMKPNLEEIEKHNIRMSVKKLSEVFKEVTRTR